ncbi:hypothetical protein F4860DRAFT_492578 [Xylaria cubensis]|nr:hypothetical protein F4860DRAFT_492578 [Xylaria cubensis]
MKHPKLLARFSLSGQHRLWLLWVSRLHLRECSANIGVHMLLEANTQVIKEHWTLSSLRHSIREFERIKSYDLSSVGAGLSGAGPHELICCFANSS